MPIPKAPDGMILGVDTSTYQGKLDVPALMADGVSFSFLYCKATDGRQTVDTQFAATVAACRAAGLPWGCYGVLEPYGASAVQQQAAHFVGIVADAGATLPPWLDFELAHGETGSVALQCAADWCDAVGFALGVQPWVYTGPSFIETLERDAGFSDAIARLGQRRLVVAHYTQDYARPPIVPSPWGDWTLWQASGGKAESRNYATLPGTQIAVDVDLFRGTVQDLLAFR